VGANRGRVNCELRNASFAARRLGWPATSLVEEFPGGGFVWREYFDSSQGVAAAIEQ
jgi:hypothetical protein